MLDISVSTHTEDFSIFKEVINKGLDARLEAFTESEFYIRDDRLYLDIDDSEIQILIRRLLEVGTEDADNWAEDIINYTYRGWYNML